MSIEKVIKVGIIGQRGLEDAFFKELQKLSVFQPILNKQFFQFNLADLKKRTQQVLQFFEQQFPETLLEKMSINFLDFNQFDSLNTSTAKFQESADNINKIAKYLEDIEILNNKIKNNFQIMELLEGFSQCDFSLSTVNQSQLLKCFIGSMSRASFELFIQKKDLKMEVDILNQIHQKVFCLILTDDRDKMLQQLNLFKFEQLQYSNTKVTLSLEYKRLMHENETLVLKIRALEASIKALRYTIGDIKLLFDYISSHHELEHCMTAIKYSEIFFYCFGFIGENDLPLLQKLCDHFVFINYEEVKLDQQDIIPSKLNNSNMIKPFEFITQMYGLPGNKEIDPTKIIAPFFSIFLGFCIGDAGYGLILMFITLFALSKFKLETTQSQIFKVGFFGSIFSIIIGLLTGNILGIDFEKFGIHLWKLYDPVKDTQLALGISLGIGFIQVFTSYLSKMLQGIKMKEFADAFLDAFPMLLIMIALMIFGLKFIYPLDLSSIALGMGGIAVLMIFLFSGRKEANGKIGAQLLWGLYGVYSISSLLGDILSYARLFALGLAGGILAQVFNQLIGGLLLHISFNNPYIAIKSSLMIILFIVAILFAHTLNFSLALLGAFIHTIRLQFVEFFGKFYFGGGVAFKPLSLKLKYFVLKNKN